jgi:hypothetical protein
MRQIGPLFGVSHSAAHRVVDSLGPLLALAPVRRRRVDQVAIVDGTLVPTRDHRIAEHKILRDYRRAGHTLTTTSGIAFLHNLASTG